MPMRHERVSESAVESFGQNNLTLERINYNFIC